MTNQSASLDADYAIETIINGQQEKLFRLYVRQREGRDTIDPNLIVEKANDCFDLHFIAEDGQCEKLTDVPGAVVRAAQRADAQNSDVMIINLNDDGAIIDGQLLRLTSELPVEPAQRTRPKY